MSWLKNKSKKIMKYYLIISLISISIVSAQTDSTKIDSLKESSTKIIEQRNTLHSINTFEIRESFFTDFSAYPELEFLKMEAENQAKRPINFRNIQTELLANFKQSMQWKADYSLGVFGEILGKAMTATAIGLGAASIAKYGKDYFSSKKRKK